MKVLCLEIQRCGRCPFGREWDGGWGHCFKERMPVRSDCAPPSWCPLPEAERDAALEALEAIAEIGGNLPDESLTDRTGPNDAKMRGLMYCHARAIARTVLEKARKR